MLSCIHEGKVLDFHWKKRVNGYLFYIGDILIGEVYHGTLGGWDCHGWGHEGHRAPLVTGFRLRYDCAKYLLEYQRYWLK